MNKTERIIELRRKDASITLTEIANELDVDLHYVTQVIAKKRKKGVVIPRGTSTSRGHVGKYSSKKAKP